MESACPHCARPLPEVAGGPAVIHRCGGCGSLLLFASGRLMRATRPSDPTPAAVEAVPISVPRPNMPTPDDSLPFLTPLRPEAEPPAQPIAAREPPEPPAKAQPGAELLFPDLADQSGRRARGGGQVAIEVAVEERATPLPAPLPMASVIVEPEPAALEPVVPEPPPIEVEVAPPEPGPAPPGAPRRLGERSASDISVVGELGARPARRRSSLWLALPILLLGAGGVYLGRHRFGAAAPSAAPSPGLAIARAAAAPPTAADTDDDRLADFQRALADGDFDRALVLRNELAAGSPVRTRADQRWPEVVRGYSAAHLARAKGQHCADARLEADRVLAIDPASRGALAIVRRCDHEHHRLPAAPRDDGPAPEHPPLAAALDLSSSLLSGAMDDYVHHDFAAAIDKTRRVLRKGDDAKAWQILGAASCFTGDAKTAKEAQGHVAGGAQKNIDYLCSRNGVDLK